MKAWSMSFKIVKFMKFLYFVPTIYGKLRTLKLENLQMLYNVTNIYNYKLKIFSKMRTKYQELLHTIV